MTYKPEDRKDKPFNDIAKAEAQIAECMADFICCVLDDIKEARKFSVEEKIELFKCLILASAEKEKAIADVVNALANIIESKKSICGFDHDCTEEE